MTKKEAKMQRFLRAALLAAAVLGLGALSVLGWQWVAALRVERIDVAGARHADEEALLELAQVDTGQVMLDVDPVLVADRVRRHPWVVTADAARLPTGTLAITVSERTPVVLVLDRSGRPAHYLDRHGFAMPLAPNAAYNVPLLRGLDEDYHPVRPVQDPAVRDLLEALADASPEMDALVSDIEKDRDGQFWIYTTPTATQGAILVRLGRDDAARKLRLLHAFWHQAVRTQPQKTFSLIDLRFNSQIVTREDSRGQ